MNPYEQYMHELAQQMRSELTDNGFTSLESSEDVSNYMNNVKDDETTFVVINSTCGCAAGLARPAAVAVADRNDKSQHIKSQYSLDKIKKQRKQCAIISNKYLQALRMLYLKVQN